MGVLFLGRESYLVSPVILRSQTFLLGILRNFLSPPSDYEVSDLPPGDPEKLSLTGSEVSSPFQRFWGLSWDGFSTLISPPLSAVILRLQIFLLENLRDFLCRAPKFQPSRPETPPAGAPGGSLPPVSCEPCSLVCLDYLATLPSKMNTSPLLCTGVSLSVILLGSVVCSPVSSRLFPLETSS